MSMDGRTRRRFVYVAVACVIASAMVCHVRVHTTAAGGEGGQSEPTCSEPSGNASPDAPRAAEVDPTGTDADPDMDARFGTVRVEVPGAATGIAFVGGRYMDAPYQLERRGLAIYLNDLEVDRLEWPSKFYRRDDPPLPPGIDRDSRLVDIEEWLYRKLGYYQSHFPPLVAAKRTVEAYRDVPCIARIDVQPPDLRELPPALLTVTLQSGEVCHIMVENIDWRPWPEEEVKRALDKMMEHWTWKLERDAIFVHVGQRLGLSTSAAPEIVAILKSDQPPHEKTAALMRLFPHFSNRSDLEETLSPLLTRFEGSPQLDARVEMIRAKRERRGEPHP